MRKPCIVSLLVGLSLAAAGDGLAAEEGRGNVDTLTYRVASAGKNKALLMRVFEAVRKLEQSKHAGGSRALTVRQRISSTEFLVNAGGATDYWFIALAPQDWDNRDRFHTDAEFTDATRTFRDEAGKTITVRVMKQVKSKPAPPFTKEDFIRRLKDDETWMLPEFEVRKCATCGGDGMIEKPEELVECGDCNEGKISIDYLVTWW